MTSEGSLQYIDSRLVSNVFYLNMITFRSVYNTNITSDDIFLTESGGVHKVLEDQPVFIIAENRPFPHGTHISSMLLDTSEVTQHNTTSFTPVSHTLHVVSETLL